MPDTRGLGASHRIPQSSSHPSLGKWSHGKPRVLVVNRADMVSERDRELWHAHLVDRHANVVWTDGVKGIGVGQVGASVEACTIAQEVVRSLCLLMCQFVSAHKHPWLGCMADEMIA